MASTRSDREAQRADDQQQRVEGLAAQLRELREWLRRPGMDGPSE